MLTLRQAMDVCLCWQGSKQCRYLGSDPKNYGSFYCLKRTHIKSKVDKDTEEIKKTDNKSGLPTGDNCTGYMFFKHKKQGYDIDP